MQETRTYWGKRRDADFWIENASVEWNEAEAPFHTIARLTLLPKSRLQPDAAQATYIDVTGNSTPDSTPLGSINRARQPAEVASRKARMRATTSRGLERESAEGDGKTQQGSEATEENTRRSRDIRAAG